MTLSNKSFSPSDLNQLSIKELVKFVYGDEKGWKFAGDIATSQYGIEINRTRLITSAVEKINNPYAKD